jgi:hypothetical protein
MRIFHSISSKDKRILAEIKEDVYFEWAKPRINANMDKMSFLTRRSNLSDLHTKTVTATLITGKNATNFVGNM